MTLKGITMLPQSPKWPPLSRVNDMKWDLVLVLWNYFQHTTYKPACPTQNWHSRYCGVSGTIPVWLDIEYWTLQLKLMLACDMFDLVPV